MPAIDATTLLCFLEPDTAAPIAPNTGEPVTNAKVRIDDLITTL